MTGGDPGTLTNGLDGQSAVASRPGGQQWGDGTSSCCSGWSRSPGAHWVCSCA